VLGFADLRDWSERTAIMLCHADDRHSIELYWDGVILRSRHGSGTPPPCTSGGRGVRRSAGKEDDSREGATLSEVINRPPRHTSLAGSRSATAANSAVDPYHACSVSPALRHGRKRDAGQPGRQSVAHDHGPGERAMSLWPNKGQTDLRPPLGSGYGARRPRHAASSSRAKGAGPAELRLDAQKSESSPNIRIEPGARQGEADARARS